MLPSPRALLASLTTLSLSATLGLGCTSTSINGDGAPATGGTGGEPVALGGVAGALPPTTGGAAGAPSTGGNLSSAGAGGLEPTTGGATLAGGAGSDGGAGGASLSPLAVRDFSSPPLIINQPFFGELELDEPVTEVTWRLVEGDLPAGLNLLEDGAIEGIPLAAGRFDATVQAETGSGRTGSTFITLTVETRSWVAFKVQDRGTNQCELIIADLADPTGATHSLDVSAVADADDFHHMSFSPDGRRFSYLKHRTAGATDACDLYAVDLAPGESREARAFTTDPVSCYRFAWSPSGHAVALEQLGTRSAPLALRFSDGEAERLPLQGADYQRINAVVWLNDDLLLWGAPSDSGMESRLYAGDLTPVALTNARTLSSMAFPSHVNQTAQRIAGDGVDGQIVIDLDDSWNGIIPRDRATGTTTLARHLDPTINWVVDAGETTDGQPNVDIFPVNAFRDTAPEPLLRLEEGVLIDRAGLRLQVTCGDACHALGSGDDVTLWEAELIAGAEVKHHALPANCAVPTAHAGPWVTCRTISNGYQHHAHRPGSAVGFFPLLAAETFTTGSELFVNARGTDASFVAATSSDGVLEVYTVPLREDSTETPVRISPTISASVSGAQGAYPRWTADGTHVFYVMNRAQTDAELYSQSLWATPVAPTVRPPRNVSASNNGCSTLSTSPLGDSCKRIREVVGQPLPEGSARYFSSL